MILLNTTFCISPAHDTLFRSWAKDVYIRSLDECGFTDRKMLKLPAAEKDSLCYAIQFSLPDATNAEKWTAAALPDLLAQASAKPYNFPPDTILHFSTIMEIVE